MDWISFGSWKVSRKGLSLGCDNLIQERYFSLGTNLIVGWWGFCFTFHFMLWCLYLEYRNKEYDRWKNDV